MALTRETPRIKGGPTGATNTASALPQRNPSRERAHVMAESQATSPHPSFQPRDGKAEIAVLHLLWMIRRKTFVKPSGCWTWGGPRNDSGYGILEVAGRHHRVHRVVYEYCVAPLSDQSLVLHHCDNPPCCNPAHLYAGDHHDNMIDCLVRERQPTVILSADMVRQIREMATGPARRSRRAIAGRLGVTVHVIDDVLSGRTWGHVK